MKLVHLFPVSSRILKRMLLPVHCQHCVNVCTDLVRCKRRSFQRHRWQRVVHNAGDYIEGQ